jgi:hypothetical protein
MRDIERELRALGDRERGNDASRSSLGRGALRHIRMARLLTSGVALLAVLGLVAGGTYAAGAIGDAPVIRTAEDPDPSRSVVVLASSLETGRVFLNFDLARRGVCYGGDLRSLERMDIVEASAGGDTVLSLFPADDDSIDYGYLCVNELSRSAMERVIASPERFSLASVTAGTAHIAGLSLSEAEPSSECFSVGFRPTYLPNGWSAQLQEQSSVAPGPAENNVGFYGAPGGGEQDSPHGYADLSLESGPVGPQEDGDLEVLGAETTFVEADEYHGSHIRFGFGDCTYLLIATAISDREFIRFAEGLRAVPDEGPQQTIGGTSVTETGVTFEIALTQCSEDPELGMHCRVTGQVVNDSSEDVSLRDSWQSLHFGGKKVVGDNGPFREFFEEFFTTRHAFAIPIEAFDELPADLFFPGTPEGKCPDAIEFHASKDSQGVLVEIEQCQLRLT